MQDYFSRGVARRTAVCLMFFGFLCSGKFTEESANATLAINVDDTNTLLQSPFTMIPLMPSDV